MRVPYDAWVRRWLPMRLAALLEGMPEADYRRWLWKRLYWSSDEKPKIRPASTRMSPRRKDWRIRRDEWYYVYDESLSPDAARLLRRLRAKECVIDEDPESQDIVDNALRTTFLDLAISLHLPGLIGITPPARALDVRPEVHLRQLRADTARRVTTFLPFSDAAFRAYQNNMTFQEIKDTVATSAALSAKASDLAVRAAFDAIKDAVIQGEKVTIPGFGTFAPVKRESRKGVNPQTKEPLIIPARTVPVFKPADKFREAFAE